MRSKVLQSVCFLIGFVALVGTDARAGGAPEVTP